MHGSMHTAFHTTALNCKFHRTISGVFDLLGSVLGRQATLHKYRTHTRNELLGEIEAALEEVGDNNRLGACGTSRKKRNKTDRSSATECQSMSHKMKSPNANAPDQSGVT